MFLYIYSQDIYQGRIRKKGLTVKFGYIFAHRQMNYYKKAKNKQQNAHTWGFLSLAKMSETVPWLLKIIDTSFRLQKTNIFVPSNTNHILLCSPLLAWFTPSNTTCTAGWDIYLHRRHQYLLPNWVRKITLFRTSFTFALMTTGAFSRNVGKIIFQTQVGNR